MTKPSLVLAFSLLAFFQWASSRVTAHNNPVVDVDGKELEAGIDYYVLSDSWRSGRGGGLSISGLRGRHSSYVVQHEEDERRGKRVRFTPASSINDGIIRQPLPRSWAAGEQFLEEATADQRVIQESKDLNIQFSSMTSVWQLGEAGHSGVRYVRTEGKAEHSGCSTINNWFRIERADEYAYTILHCPSVCETCKTECGVLGITYEDGIRYLSLPDHHHSLEGHHRRHHHHYHPLLVTFMRAEN